MARHKKWTAAVRKMLLAAIKMGATHELAAGYAGIGESTFYEWMKEYPELSKGYKYR